ncbi:hypothetical protein NUU61_004119 [Penicillium alfredii]|uniref:Sugar phosphate transporter domain-containing protein n=1 Tax=Penicillium alfredii TaxID=1506179 RepID=A0A9W9KEC0_9EURO|nr:uncharacterized protein NUU61_004119 [Penicillium alfredii]KAJ5101897.1 hypothetical protein NUU61_004119 [Penicillium alfredii]
MAPSHESEEVGMRLLSESAQSSPRTSLSSSTLSVEDKEAYQKEALQLSPVVQSEYETPARVKYAWLGAYLVFAMALTIHNKFVLQKFNCPWLLTTLHGAFSALGAFMVWMLGYFKLSTLSTRDHLILVVYSVLFSVNIFFSNWSLALVSLALFQILRNTSPIFTVFIYRFWYSRSYSTATYISLIPIILGAGLTAKGDFNYSYLGLIVSGIGVVLGVIKIVATNQLMTGTLELGSMELLYRMSIYSTIQTAVIGALAGEFSVFSQALLGVAKDESPLKATSTIALLVLNGVVAFLLNIASFETNKVAGALAVTVSGNLRQTLTLVLGIFIMGDFEFNIQTGFGIVLVVIGCALYSKAELDSKKSVSSVNR